MKEETQQTYSEKNLMQRLTDETARILQAITTTLTPEVKGNKVRESVLESLQKSFNRLRKCREEYLITEVGCQFSRLSQEARYKKLEILIRIATTINSRLLVAPSIWHITWTPPDTEKLLQLIEETKAECKSSPPSSAYSSWKGKNDIDQITIALIVDTMSLLQVSSGHDCYPFNLETEHNLLMMLTKGMQDWDKISREGFDRLGSDSYSKSERLRVAWYESRLLRPAEPGNLFGEDVLLLGYILYRTSGDNRFNV
ncbi:hypothetical protein BDP55DRAFT_676193 [Colletotrichum godetiae]|uniref:Uncharacterized protein n=1 Tax=Colletotrichum godetiae TaxID=1209918 RepID=A0AAJ0EQB2_9PEZI|nr:uncharacterized protein BDP55DRAFT_676193 [Colletotrichum godetiae]KAK1671437.1 hypothetical protein BDP55DRAFT_676193 [Colletotrichum godetiae]